MVTTQAEAAVELTVDFLAPSARPTNESCASPLAIALEQPIGVSLIDASKDVASACVAQTGELTYRFSLAEAADVRIYSSATHGAGTPVVGLRDASCTGAEQELSCTSSTALPLYARALQAGAYVVTVGGTSPIDASVTVHASPPTSAPPDQTCGGAPEATTNGSPEPVSLKAHTDAIKDGCYPGHPNAARAFSLPVPSDVLVVGRFPQNERGALSLDRPTCSPAAVVGCASGQTPVRVSRRNLPAGDYRVVIADDLGEDDSVNVLVRPTAAPTLVGAQGDTCAAAFEIPESGGFFSGDTTALGAEWDDGCDTSTPAPGGAPDQVGRLVLTQPRRVVLDMSGSTYTTILDVRQGPACPGSEVPNTCYVGFGPSRSFLDVTLAAGTYWIVIDGYAGGSGAWNLDVRVF